MRLVVAVANIAMNAWGDESVLQMATGLHRKHGDRSAPANREPSDSDLDDVATIDTDLVETDVGILPFPPRPDVPEAILKLLLHGAQSSRDSGECPC